MQIISKPSYEEMEKLVKAKESFKIVGATKQILKYCADLERIVESNGMTCRVYTKNRGWVTAVTAYFTLGASLIAYVGHNLLTRNPDYLIGRELVNNTIEVKYNDERG